MCPARVAQQAGIGSTCDEIGKVVGVVFVIVFVFSKAVHNICEEWRLVLIGAASRSMRRSMRWLWVRKRLEHVQCSRCRIRRELREEFGIHEMEMNDGNWSKIHDERKRGEESRKVGSRCITRSSMRQE